MLHYVNFIKLDLRLLFSDPHGRFGAACASLDTGGCAGCRRTVIRHGGRPRSIATPPDPARRLVLPPHPAPLAAPGAASAACQVVSPSAAPDRGLPGS